MKRQENFLVLVYEVCRLFNLRLLGLTLTARLVFLCLASYLISDKFFILFALSYLRYLNTIRKKGGVEPETLHRKIEKGLILWEARDKTIKERMKRRFTQSY